MSTPEAGMFKLICCLTPAARTSKIHQDLNWKYKDRAFVREMECLHYFSYLKNVLKALSLGISLVRESIQLILSNPLPAEGQRELKGAV